MEEFQIALGRVRIEDEVLMIERPDPDELGRWRLFRWSIPTLARHRPLYLGAYAVGFAVFGGVFAWLLVDIYTTNPAAAPIVIGLLLLGVVVVVATLEHTYRRGMSQRDALLSDLETSYDHRRVDRIPLADVTGVTLRQVNEDGPLVDGLEFLVHFDRNGERATTRLGIPKFMTDAPERIESFFEAHDIPVRGE